MKKSPNLFNYATSELSQDAMICWLLAHADPKYKDNTDPQLQTVALNLINRFLQLSGHQSITDPIRSESFEIRKQVKHIDIVVKVNQYVILIEDKTVANIHGDQLNQYKKTFDKEYNNQNLIIVPIFFKTFDQSTYQQVEQAGFTPFLRQDLLEVLSPFSKIDNDIFQDYYQYVSQIEMDVEAFRTTALKDWKGRQWMGFFKALQQELKNVGIKSHWKYVANASGGQQVLWLQGEGHPDSRQYLQLQSHKVKGIELVIRLSSQNSKLSNNIKSAIIHHIQKNFELQSNKFPHIQSIIKVDKLGHGKTISLLTIKPKDIIFSTTPISLNEIAQFIAESSHFLAQYHWDADAKNH